jgi:NADH-quinone oxidoreductase subunit J
MMAIPFYIVAAVAIVATALTITRVKVVHALLYLVVSLLAAAVMFYMLGAPFVAALEVIVYAGAIMVLFIFTVMMLNLGRESEAREAELLSPGAWMGASALSAVLLVQVILVLHGAPSSMTAVHVVGPKQTGVALYGPYLLVVELVSILLLGALVGAFHLGWQRLEWREGGDSESRTDRPRADRSGSPVLIGGDRADRSPEHPVRADVHRDHV